MDEERVYKIMVVNLPFWGSESRLWIVGGLAHRETIRQDPTPGVPRTHLLFQLMI